MPGSSEVVGSNLIISIFFYLAKVFKDNYTLQNEIINELRFLVIKLIQDPNGNHVIQKCFETVPSSKLEFIVDEVIVNVKKKILILMKTMNK